MSDTPRTDAANDKDFIERRLWNGENIIGLSRRLEIEVAALKSRSGTGTSLPEPQPDGSVLHVDPASGEYVASSSWTRSAMSSRCT